MKINNIDHIVLTVGNMDETVRFYESVLGMEVVTFGKDRVALRFGDQKINLHQQGRELDPAAKEPLPGSADLCFITETELEIAIEQTRNMGIKILEGPIERTGATGAVCSFYIRDPDGNLIEIANRL